MQDKLKVLIQELIKTQEEDFVRRKNRLKKMYSTAHRFEKLCSLRKDWAEKRIKSILREAERCKVTIIEVRGNNVTAEVDGTRMRGVLAYETRGAEYNTSIWTRPRITLRLWYVNRDDVMFTYEGKKRSHYRSYGGEGISFIFGKKRLMTYNRLLQMLLNCMGK